MVRVGFCMTSENTTSTPDPPTPAQREMQLSSAVARVEAAIAAGRVEHPQLRHERRRALQRALVGTTGDARRYECMDTEGRHGVPCTPIVEANPPQSP